MSNIFPIQIHHRESFLPSPYKASNHKTTSGGYVAVPSSLRGVVVTSSFRHISGDFTSLSRHIRRFYVAVRSSLRQSYVAVQLFLWRFVDFVRRRSDSVRRRSDYIRRRFDHVRRRFDCTGAVPTLPSSMSLRRFQRQSLGEE